MLHYSTPLKLVCPIIAFPVCCPIRQTVDRCFSAQTVAWADLHPFAVQSFWLCTVVSPDENIQTDRHTAPIKMSCTPGLLIV